MWKPKKVFSTGSSENFHSYVPDSYVEGRKQFREGLRQIKRAELETLTVIENFSEEGADPIQNLTIDIGIIPSADPNDKRVLINVSGVHGSEGHAGSGIQAGILQQLIEMEKKSGDDCTLPTIVLIHAVNPYGFHTGRRWNEGNVDLNRNALTDEEFKQLRAKDKNDLYSKIVQNGLLAGEGAHTDFFGKMKLYSRVPYMLIKHGFYEIKAALVTGQYHTKAGVFFGGFEMQKSHKLLLDFFRRHKFTEASKVVWIDIHTGMGKRGKDTLVVEEGLEAAKTLFSDEGRGRILFLGKDDGVAKGYEQTKGTSANLVKNWFSTPSENQLLLSQEFGTKSGMLVVLAITRDYFTHHFGTSEEKKIGNEICRDAFYIRSKAWKQEIVERGVGLFNDALKFFPGEALNV